MTTMHHVSPRMITLSGMKTLFLLFITASMLILGSADLAIAQSSASLNQADLSSVRAADVSDDQLRTFMQRAQNEGISLNQAMQMARQRGLPASEASALQQRITQLQMGTESESAQLEGDVEEGQREFVRPERVETERMRRIFGSSIFRERTTEFTPTSSVATPVNYTLGAGDELLINIWGDQTANYRLQVSPDGTVDIENLGPVMVSGLTIQEAEQKIRTNLRQVYSGMRESEDRQTTFARVSINRLRSIQVAISGDVVNPGDYSVASGSTLFNALFRAGGPAENGSYRSVRVIRNDNIVSEMDLYDFLVDGMQTGNVQLRDGDVVHVSSYQNRVELIGEAKRGDLLFEMKDGETLEDLIRFTGGFSENAYRQQIRIHRNTPAERRIITANYGRFNELEMQNGDVVFIDEILSRFQNRVSVNGAVWRSGDFELREGMTLLDLIEEADGLRPDAFMNRGLINRMRDDYTFEQISFDLALLYENPDRYDILLRPEDQVRIRSIHNLADERTVEINGAVRNGGAFPYRDNMTLEDLILKADGFRDFASEARIEISRRVTGDAAPNQRTSELAEVYTFSVNRDLSLSEEEALFILQPFDRVEVFRRPNYREQITVSIEGQVLYPGSYTLSGREERISDLIQRAGGLTREAYIPGARITRQLSSIDRPAIELDFLSTQSVLDEDLISMGGLAERERAQERARELDIERELEETDERSTLEQRSYLNRLNRIEEQQRREEEVADRRIGLDLERILRSPGSGEDLFLREGDVIRIPEEQQTVAIIGAVMQDVEVRYQDGRSLRYYINRAGGFSENARSGRAYVVYANGDVDRRKRYIFGLIKSNPDIEPGAQIIVPEKPSRERMNVGEVISISAAIVGMSTSLLIAIDRISR